MKVIRRNLGNYQWQTVPEFLAGDEELSRAQVGVVLKLRRGQVKSSSKSINFQATKVELLITYGCRVL